MPSHTATPRPPPARGLEALADKIVTARNLLVAIFGMTGIALTLTAATVRQYDKVGSYGRRIERLEARDSLRGRQLDFLTCIGVASMEQEPSRACASLRPN